MQGQSQLDHNNYGGRPTHVDFHPYRVRSSQMPLRPGCVCVCVLPPLDLTVVPLVPPWVLSPPGSVRPYEALASLFGLWVFAILSGFTLHWHLALVRRVMCYSFQVILLLLWVVH